ncbi:MAG TPA: alanine racemase [Rhizomicrobium sp.]
MHSVSAPGFAPETSLDEPGSGVARLRVRLDAVKENFRTCQALSNTAVAGVVKADAYGLGMAQVARALADAGCDTYFVARLEEGVALRPVVPRARIFVLDGAAPDGISALAANRLTPVLNSLDQIAAWSDAAAERATTFEAALHIDTGMNRLGLPPDELAILAGETAERLSGIMPVLIMSHLACADDESSPKNAEQLARFRATLGILPPAPASLASSGGVLLGKDYAFDLVRPGIGLYGGNPQLRLPNPFQTVAILTGCVLQLRRVDRGKTVGYGATFRPERPSTLATVGLGYADGLMRAIGNKGAGAVAGFRAPIAGRVSMDLVTLDVTDIPDVSVGSEVEFLGDTISLEEIAQCAGTAGYEVLTGLHQRVPRHYTGSQ